MSEYSFEPGALAWHYKDDAGSPPSPVIVVARAADEESAPHRAGHPEGCGYADPGRYYRVLSEDGEERVAFFRSLFPRWPVADAESHKVPLDPWREIRLLDGANVRHRSGVRLGEATAEAILDHAKKEIAELEAAPDDVDEMADTMAILIHYCVRKGWTRERVDEAIMRKLALRLDVDWPRGL